MIVMILSRCKLNWRFHPDRHWYRCGSLSDHNYVTVIFCPHCKKTWESHFGHPPKPSVAIEHWLGYVPKIDQIGCEHPIYWRLK